LLCLGAGAAFGEAGHLLGSEEDSMRPLARRVTETVAVSILFTAAGCREATEPELPSIAAAGTPASASSADRKAPTRPANLRSTGNTSWSVSLAWDASTDDSGSLSYRVRDNWGREITVSGTQTSVTWKYPAHPPLNAGSSYSFAVYAVDAAGNKSSTSNNVTVALPLDTQAPTVPAFTVTSLGTRHISLRWSSTDDSPFISYTVTKDGVPISSAGFTWVSDTSRTFTLLQPGSTYTFTAQARDRYVNVSGGNLSAVSPPFSVTTKANDGSDVTAPTAPAPVQAFLYGDGSTEMEVSWGASSDDVTPRNVIIYEVYVNGALENTAVGTTQTNAYGVMGENVVTVVAVDEAGNRSTAGKTTLTIAF
jgi:fibronectin type 3 domain-containing protein